MNPAALTDLALNAALDLGFDLAGVAPAGPSPDFDRFQQWLADGHHGDMAYLARRAAERADLLAWEPAARSAILLGVTYARERLPDALRNDPSRGLIAAYAWGDDYHEALKPLLFQLDARLRAATGRTTLGRAFVDSGPVLERSWAQAAGLGFIGKNSCLIAPRHGSWLILAGLLVPETMAPCVWPAMEIQLHASGSTASRPSPAGTCGRCTRCLEICPTGALLQPHLLDARRCISYLTIELKGAIPRELRPLMGNWIFGCDLCQEVCPWNVRFARPARQTWLQPRSEMAAPRLLDLLALDDDSFRQRFKNSPVRRAKRRGLLRNVCVALGNGRDPAAVQPLIAALNDHEPLIRQHAAWALGRIGGEPARAALHQRLANEADLDTCEEIAHAIASLAASA